MLHGLRPCEVDRRRVVAPIVTVDPRRSTAEVESPGIDSVDVLQQGEGQQWDEGSCGRDRAEDDQRSAGPASELQLTI